MAYLTHFNDQHYEIIRSIMPKIETLQPGTAAEINCGSTAKRSRVRYVLYSWLHYNNLSSQYTVKTEGEAYLRVLKKDTFANLKVSIPDQESAEFVREFLIDVLDESEATEICSTQGLAGPELVRTITEWRRIQGL